MSNPTGKSTIVCFTASYPYGTRETYFNTELQYLSNAFDKVYILPTYNSSKSKNQRKVPDNTVILPIASPQGISRILQGIFNISPIMPFVKDILKNKAYKKKSTFKQWFNTFLVFRIKYRKLKKILKNIEPDTLLYSYWGGPTVFTTNLCKPYKKIVRMHGGDFYLNRNNGYLPLRKRIYESADLLLPISDDIATKLREDYAIEADKIFLNYLGVNNSEITSNTTTENIIRVVSCSNVYPLKRVQIIASTVCNWKSNAQIEWHHFGDGPEMKNITEFTTNHKNTNASIILHGWTSAEDIYKFYNSHYITWFINVSKYEGVPVSIMEAFSFGVPAIATNAGATSEIVNNTNGQLIDLEVTNGILENYILSCFEKDYPAKRLNAQITWKEKFNAEKNYTSLTNKLKSLLVL